MKQHKDKFTKLLKGKTIKRVDYLTDDEVKEMYWHSKAPVIEFTDGSCLYPMRDDEGNDAGSLSYISEDGSNNQIIYSV